jgi:hypothetical protein
LGKKYINEENKARESFNPVPFYTKVIEQVNVKPINNITIDESKIKRREIIRKLKVHHLDEIETLFEYIYGICIALFALWILWKCWRCIR